MIAKPVALTLPGGDGGIGFDDLMFSPSLHRVLAPAGRTGKLDLIDPKTQKVDAIIRCRRAELRSEIPANLAGWFDRLGVRPGLTLRPTVRTL